MKLSPFVYNYRLEQGVTCLYHSLTLKKVYLDDLELAEVEHCLRPDRSRGPTESPNFKTLEDLSFVVPDDYDAAGAFQQVSRRLAQESPQPALSYVLLTDVCNFRCDYCFIENALASTGHSISEDQVGLISKVILRQLREKGTYSVTFYGGEPLTNSDTLFALVETLNTAAPGRFRFSMVTNGSLVTDELAERISATSISVGVSLDGWSELNVNRTFTGGGETTYDALRAIATLKKHKAKVGVSCTVTKTNVDHLIEIVDFVSKLHVTGIGFNLVLDKRAQVHAVEDPTELARKMFHASVRAIELGMGEDRIGHRRVEPFFKEEFRAYDCPAYGRQIFFSPNGTVGPCQAFYTTPLYQEKLTDDFDPRRSQPFLDFIEMGGTLKSAECMRCPAIAICGGSCPYDVFTKTGVLSHLDPYYCEFMREILHLLVQFYYDRKVNSVTVKSGLSA